MKNLFHSVLLSAFLTWPLASPLLAETRTPQDLFNIGVQNFQSQNYEQSAILFKQLLQREPKNIEALYNLGLVQWNRNHRGQALGLWRKALSLNPRHTLSKKALRSAQKEAPALWPPPSSNSWALLRTFVLQPWSLHVFLLANWIFFLVTGVKLISLFSFQVSSQTKEMSQEREWQKSFLDPNFFTQPSFFGGRSFSALLLLSLLLLSLTLTFLKIKDLQTPRGTIVEKKTQLRTGPSLESPQLFEIFEGFEVEILRQQGSWLQVELAEDRSGWLKSSSLFFTSKSP